MKRADSREKPALFQRRDDDSEERLETDDLRDRIKFDRDSLDDAIQEHADLVLRAGDRYAMALSVRDKAKTDMDNEYARACLRARRSTEKVTEGVVKENAQLDDEYRAAEAVYLKAKLEADTALSLREAIDARGKMLGKMAELYLGGYYAIHSVKGDTRRAIDADAAAQARRALHSARINR